MLPYEVPFILTNEGFYNLSKRSKKLDVSHIFDSIIFKNNSETRPLTYKITKDTHSERTLFLPHPAIQIKVCNLYRDYNQLITHLCNRSSFSLRYPSKIAHSYYAKNESSDSDPSEKLKDEGVAIDGDLEPIYASTFF